MAVTAAARPMQGDAQRAGVALHRFGRTDISSRR